MSERNEKPLRWRTGCIPAGEDVLFQVAKRKYNTYLGIRDETGFMIESDITGDGICYEDDVTRWILLRELLAAIGDSDE
jgi:hypothetical protein